MEKTKGNNCMACENKSGFSEQKQLNICESIAKIKCLEIPRQMVRKRIVYKNPHEHFMAGSQKFDMCMEFNMEAFIKLL